MERLLEGYRRFRSEVWPKERVRFETLARQGQRPETLVIACSDSRVDPQTVFGAAPGELFVARNVAGLVPPYEPDAHYHGTSAALEFGVRILKVANVVVLGHAQCGGVRAMVDSASVEGSDFIKAWMGIASPVFPSQARCTPEEETYTLCEKEVVRLSLANLLTFPWIAEAKASGKLQLHGFRFSIRTGVLAMLDGDDFVPVS
jgi:carbonic anhydrase